jgi:hypothetical protein
MHYPFRYDFMANAVDEYGEEIAKPMTGNICPDRICFRAHMVDTLTLKQRNDWFAMYVMGGQPFPQRSLQEDEANRQWHINKRVKELHNGLTNSIEAG